MQHFHLASRLGPGTWEVVGGKWVAMCNKSSSLSNILLVKSSTSSDAAEAHERMDAGDGSRDSKSYMTIPLHWT
jgi:hypothetical protein